MKKRISSLVLAVAMCFSLLTTAGPSVGAVYVYTPEVSTLSIIRTGIQNVVTSAGFVWFDEAIDIFDGLTFPYVGQVTPTEMGECQRYYNENIIGKIMRTLDWKRGNGYLSEAYLVEDTENGIWRLADTQTNQWITDQDGDFPFFYAAGDVPEAKGPRWLSASGSEITNNISRTSYEALSALQIELSVEYGHPCSLYKTKIGPKGKEVECWTILDEDWYYYCDGSGNRYAAVIEPSATGTVRPSIDNSGNLIEGDNGLILDIENGVLNLVDQVGDQHQLTIEELEFDFGDNNYTVNAFTKEGDTYNYYTYEVTYNITNTYITYIGSNEAYEREEYELYYQLPDGRSSADLTADEVAGMSFEFYDVVNYERSTDDISVQALYHFDGNIDDSSYFSGLTDGFKWVKNASITYMEAPEPFGGALYLDERAHEFTIDLPEDIVLQDFTVTFRYYQASEPDTLDNIENGLYIGDQLLFHWDEQNAYNASGTVLGTSFAVGTWQEITFQRYGSRFNVFINGVRASNLSKSAYLLDDKITFRLGDTSRAYSMIDELRVVDHALYPSETSYTTTSVPYDSNLILVLPDAERPMADKYYEIQSSGTNLLGNAFNFLDGGSTSNFVGEMYTHSSGASLASGQATYYSTNFLPLAGDRYVLFQNIDDEADGDPTYGQTNAQFMETTGYMIPVYSADGFKANTDYTLSIVRVDGTIESHTFNTGTLYKNARPSAAGEYSKWISQTAYSWGYLRYGYMVTTGASSVSAWHNVTSCIFISPSKGKNVDIAYIEVVKGTSSDIKLVGVTDVYDGADIQPNTAAIQTTIPVKGYTVGGVRPSMPSKGDLWFPVMENRITSVQIYTGSMWQEVGARWFTGSRWIPIYAFDITTLEDLFDIADGDDVVSLLPDTNSFFRWWQLQWLDFRQWLERTLGSGGGSAVPDDELLPPIQDDDGNGLSFVGLLGDLIVGIWDLGSGLYTVVFKPVFTNIGSSVSSITDVFSGEGAFDISVPEGGSIWD